MDKHYATVIGKETVLRYVCRHAIRYDGYEVAKISEVVSYPVLWEGELANPVLFESDNLYIDTLDIVVHIRSSARTTTGGMRYYTTYNRRLPDDEQTAISLKEAEDELNKIALARNEFVTEKRSWFRK